MTLSFKECIFGINCKFVRMMKCIKPLANLLIRLYIANIFIKSGLVKIGDWQATLFLFQNEYKIDFMSYQLAAVLATTLELVIAPMLLLGLATRYSALLLLIMTLVMNYGYHTAPENYYWMTLLAILMVYGGSKLSIDYIIRKKYCIGNGVCPCCCSASCMCSSKMMSCSVEKSHCATGMKPMAMKPMKSHGRKTKRKKR